MNKDTVFRGRQIMNSRFITTNMLFILVFPWLLYADTCYVASGQTVAFTLSAGVKASWNNTVSGVRQRSSQSRIGTAFSVYQLSNGNIAFKTPNFKNDVHFKVLLFSVNGRKIDAVEMDGQARGEFNKNLIPGIYLARLEVDGILLKTTRFLLGR
jgi:hypothetical protein